MVGDPSAARRAEEKALGELADDDAIPELQIPSLSLACGVLRVGTSMPHSDRVFCL